MNTDEFNKNLKPFQKLLVARGVYLFNKGNKYFYNAGDVGTGKTRTSIYTICSIRSDNKHHILCVTNGSTRINWQREIELFDASITSKPLVLFKESDIKKLSPDTTWIIISYKLILNPRIQRELLLWGIDYTIFDEAQYLKSYKAACTRICTAITRLPNVKFSLWLSGTPVKSSLLDMYPYLAHARDDLISDFYEYAEAFCEKVRSPYNSSYNYVGGINIDKWKKLVNPVFSRVKKEDVLEELPDLTYQMIYCKGEDSLRKEVKSLEKSTRFYYDEEGKRIVLPPNISELRRRTYLAKHLEVSDFVTNLLDQDKAIILVYYHRDLIELALKEFHSYKPLCITGSTSAVKRQEIVDSFNTDENKKILIGQIDALGVGINLQHRCETIIFGEVSFTPDSIIQACGRINRIGQTNPCMAYITILTDSYEERIMDINMTKLKLQDRAIDG